MGKELILYIRSCYGKECELYSCCNIDVVTLIDYATNNQLHTKTCQKPYAKNPQKPHKNLLRKNPAKIFYDFFNKKPAKNFKYIQKLPNFTLYINKTKNPCTN